MLPCEAGDKGDQSGVTMICRGRRQFVSRGSIGSTCLSVRQTSASHDTRNQSVCSSMVDSSGSIKIVCFQKHSMFSKLLLKLIIELYFNFAPSEALKFPELEQTKRLVKYKINYGKPL